MKLTYNSKRKTKYGTLIIDNLNEIQTLYENGMCLTKIGEKLHIDRKTLAKLFKDNGIKTRDGFEYVRKYPINEHYFDLIDTEEKAYMMGFIYADGNNLFKNNRISIQLSSIDEEILNKFSYMVYGQIVLNKNKRTNKDGKIFEYTTLNIFNHHISQHLASLGVVERKSHKIIFPEWLDKNLYRDFIRGLIDGDGWIYLPKKEDNRNSPNVGLICTRKMNDFLKDFFEKELGLKSYLTKANKQNFDVMCEIRIKNYHRCKIFLDWLYLDSNIYLDRKYQIYQNFLSRYNLLREQNK